METTKQISVFLENKPGRLANVLLALAREKVNITALTVMDSHEHNVLRFVVDQAEAAHRVLKEMSIPFADTEIMDTLAYHLRENHVTLRLGEEVVRSSATAPAC